MGRALDILLPGPPRPVWSLIVTALGDLTRDSGAGVGGAELGRLLGPLGVSAPAVRTALHRLRADGWVETERCGRASSHRLTAHGLAETRAAAARIYALGPPETSPVLSLVFGAGPPGTASLPGGLHLRAGPLGDDAGMEGTRLRLAPAQAAALWPEGLRADAADLLGRLDAVAQAPLEPAEAGPARLLVVHDWRRIALRAPPLPDALGPPDWPGAALRAAVAGALDRVPAQCATS
jgi:phenylacetic acid degradation operon negative regulatory protein